MADDYLAHYGVLGMKWGVRRYQNRDGSLIHPKRNTKNRHDKKNISNDRIKAYRNRSMLSDEELDKRIRRLEKEKKLRELTRSEVTPGRNYVDGAMSKYGGQIVSVAIGAAVGTAVTKGVKTILDS